LYAESEDGLKWRRIALKLAKYGGSVKNNIVFTDLQADNKEFARLRNRAVKTCKMPLFSHLVIAPNPSWDGKSGTRYCGLMMKGGAKPHGLLPLSSPDGLKWRSLAHPDEPVIPSSDEYRLVCDTERKLLIATMKLYGFFMDIPLSVPEYGREVGLSTSTDGVTWTAPEFIYHADEADRKAGAETVIRHTADPDYRSPLFINPEDSWTDIYNMPVFPYHGIYIALPSMFHHSGYWVASKYSANQDGLIWPGLAWSKDLRDWKRPAERNPFIPLSPCADREIYDNGMIMSCPPVAMNGELRFYYSGSRYSHVTGELAARAGMDYSDEREQAGIFLARMRLDGFASMRSGGRKGSLLTKPVTANEGNLHVNARTRNGEILAELRDAESGRVIPGFGLGDYLGGRKVSFGKEGRRTRLAGPGTRRYDEEVKNDSIAFSGDEVDAVMKWKGKKSLSALKGRKVRIMFALHNADIYSFWFA